MGPKSEDKTHFAKEVHKLVDEGLAAGKGWGRRENSNQKEREKSLKKKVRKGEPCWRIHRTCFACFLSHGRKGKVGVGVGGRG
jgi:hypothetical protein